MNDKNHIRYLYDAAGTKLRKYTAHDRAGGHTTDYCGSFVYEEGELQYLLTHGLGDLGPSDCTGSNNFSRFSQ